MAFYKRKEVDDFYKQNKEKVRLIDIKKKAVENKKEIDYFEKIVEICIEEAINKKENVNIISSDIDIEDYDVPISPYALNDRKYAKSFIDKFRNKYPNMKECMTVSVESGRFDFKNSPKKKMKIDINCFIPGPTEVKKRQIKIKKRNNIWKIF